MKHDIKPTLILIILFFSAQMIGLFLLKNITTKEVVGGEIIITVSEPTGGRPQFENESQGFVYILSMILLGTGILLILIKFKLYKIWKGWFFLAIGGSIFFAFETVLPQTVALVLSFVIAYLKLFKPNAIIHNVSEVFMYSGLVIMISPIFNLLWATLLLVAISIYDVIAVWKSRHMVKMATVMSEQKMFAGMLVPYSKKKEISKKSLAVPAPKKTSTNTKVRMNIPSGFGEDTRSAILGGGDIAFPMIFAGNVMTHLLNIGYSLNQSYFLSLFVSLFSGIALAFLLIFSKKDKFYPAMPFISLGCFIGYAVTLLF